MDRIQEHWSPQTFGMQTMLHFDMLLLQNASSLNWSLHHLQSARESFIKNVLTCLREGGLKHSL